MKDKNIVFLTLSSIHIGLFHALRSPEIYPDTPGYSEAFYNISKSSFWDLFSPLNIDIHPANTWEKGYVVTNWLLGKLGESSELLFIFSSVLIVGSFMWAVRKWSSNIVLSVIIFLIYPVLFYQSLYVLRQHMAMGFVWYALGNIDKPKKYFLLLFLASTFHASAIILAPFYFFYKYCRNRIDISRVSLCGLIIAVVINALCITPIISVIPSLAEYDVPESNVLPLFILATTFVMHYVFGAYKRSIFNNSDSLVLIYLLYGVCVSIIFIGVPGGGRLSNYFTYILPFAIPLILKFRTSCIQYDSCKVFFVVALLCFLAYWSSISHPDALPYQFFWE